MCPKQKDAVEPGVKVGGHLFGRFELPDVHNENHHVSIGESGVGHHLFNLAP